MGTAGAVAVGAAFGLHGVADQEAQPPGGSGSALDVVFHERADLAASRGGIGRAPLAGGGAVARARAPESSPAPVTPGAPVGEAPEDCESYSGNRLIGCTLLDEFGFGVDQMPALDRLWSHESGWNHEAYNSSSGAYGIPQALPGSKMSSAGDDWETNPATQIRWGLGYITDRYGDPNGAWAFFQANGWY